MGKIVLVNPSFEPIYIYKPNDMTDPPNVPRGVLAIGTYLKQKGHTVKIIDAVIEEDAAEKIVKEAEDADFVGFAVMTSSIISSLKLSKLVKEKTKAKTVWGGIHPTQLPEQTCADPLVDYAVHGEGDEAILELLEGHDPAEIKSLAYKTADGRVIVNPRRKFFDINKIATLDFDLVDVEKYITRTLVQERRKVRMLPVMSSRGCPHRCTFCFHTTTGDQPYRTQESERVIAEIGRLKECYNVDAIKFAEDNFFVIRRRVKEVLEGIKGLGLKWVGECRADYFRNGHVDDELLQLMKESGCAGFTVGAESGSEKILNMVKKDVIPKQVEYAVSRCYEHNFVPAVTFILGFPHETKRDVKKTVSLLRKVVKKCPILIGGIGLFRPNPGGDLYEECFKISKIKKPASLREWTKPEYLDLMINASDIPWNKHSRWIKNVHYYAGMYLFTNRRLGMYIKRNFIKGLGFSSFVMLARLRCLVNFYHLPVDRKLFNIALRVAGHTHILNWSFGSRKKRARQYEQQLATA